ncbi:MAG: glycoside hydrolase family 3 N-terminal domain-containing protein [Crocinitomicaceae bacterium]
MISKFLISFFFLSVMITGCSQPESTPKSAVIIKETIALQFVLDDFFTNNIELDQHIDSIYDGLNNTQRIAQLIMPAAGKYGQAKETIDGLIKDSLIGGILMLNGTVEEFTQWIKEFEDKNKANGNLPFLFSADAEPSLVNRKIMGSTPVKKANELNSIKEVEDVANKISGDLNKIGINYNFSPVVDMSPNKTVGYRSFGKNPENIIPWSNQFIQSTQANNIIATAKHFPGHGLVSGDTHKSLQVINGPLKEIKNYPPLIENGVLSIMVAHIAIENNENYSTQGLPSTCSKKVVTELLRDTLGFKGLIVTDAMNMGGVANVPKNASKAIAAGCDILLMPADARSAHSELLQLYLSNENEIQSSMNASVKRIIRMKICLGLL